MHMTRSPCYFEDYFMGESKLEEINEFKLLGVTFGKDLIFYSHIDSISKKVSKLSGFIIRCTKNMSPNTLFNLYKRSYCLILFTVHEFGLLIKETTWIGWKRCRGK